MLLNCGIGKDSWESLGLQGDPTNPSQRRSVLGVHWKDRCWSWNSNTLATSCQELAHLKRPWFWERLRAGGEGDNRGWDGWMASRTWWTWVWVNSGSWWWTGRPGMLQFMGSQRVGHDWAAELNWLDGPSCPPKNLLSSKLFIKLSYPLKVFILKYKQIIFCHFSFLEEILWNTVFNGSGGYTLIMCSISWFINFRQYQYKLCGILTYYYYYYYYWLCHVACGILIPWPRIKPRPSAVRAWSPNTGLLGNSLNHAIFIYLFIYSFMATPQGMQDLSSLIMESNLLSLQWKLGALTTGPWGKSQSCNIFLKNQN